MYENSLFTLETDRNLLEEDQNPWNKEKTVDVLSKLLSNYSLLEYVNVYNFPCFDKVEKGKHSVERALKLININDSNAIYLPIIEDKDNDIKNLVQAIFSEEMTYSRFLILFRQFIEPIGKSDDLIDCSKICTIPNISDHAHTWSFHKLSEEADMTKITTPKVVLSHVIENILKFAKEGMVLFKEIDTHPTQLKYWKIHQRADGEKCWILED